MSHDTNGSSQAGVEEFPPPEPASVIPINEPPFAKSLYTAKQVRDVLRSYSASLGLQARKV